MKSVDILKISRYIGKVQEEGWCFLTEMFLWKSFRDDVLNLVLKQTLF